MSDLKWAEGVKPEPMQHYKFSEPRYHLDFDEVGKLIRAMVVKTTELAIVDAVIKAAEEDGISDLYIMDEKFVLDALREKIEREGEKL